MDINQLKTLIHIAELGSISKAADRLGIAQPALSRQIRLMESELGASLFDRHGRGMRLTDLGERVLQPAAEILNKLDEIRVIANAGQGPVSGSVRFGMVPTIAEIMTVCLACSLRDEFPGIRLCIRSAFSGHLIEWLKRDEIDCLVSYEPEHNAALRTTPIMVETLLLVGNADSDRAMDSQVDFADLATIPLVLPSAMHGLRRVVDKCAVRAGITLAPVIEADSLSSMLDLVREGFGMTILPLGPISHRVSAGELSIAHLVNPVPERRLVLVFPADRPISRATRTAGEEFARITATLVEAGRWSGSILHPETG